MKYNRLGKTNFNVSELSFGASALGGVFSAIDEEEGIRTVKEVLKAGINYLDVAPAYGSTKAESVLGKALQGFDRKSYLLSTKSGKYTLDGVYGQDDFDYSEKRIRHELDLSLERLGTDYIDILHLHDFDYQYGGHVDSAFNSGFKTLLKLKDEGVIRAISAGIYNLNIWKRVIAEAPVDVIMLHNHYNLIDTTALDVISPFSILKTHTFQPNSCHK
jgi:L-galactose dehydrogenase